MARFFGNTNRVLKENVFTGQVVAGAVMTVQGTVN